MSLHATGSKELARLFQKTYTDQLYGMPYSSGSQPVLHEPFGRAVMSSQGVCEGLKTYYDLNLGLRLGGPWPWSMATKGI